MAQTKEPMSPGKMERIFTGFLGKNKKVLIILGVAIVLILAGLWIGLSIADSTANKMQQAIDDLQVSFNTWVAMEDKTSQEAVSTQENLISELSSLTASRSNSYPSVKAAYLLGLMHYELGNFSQAREHFITASTKGAKTYMGSLSLFNAGVSAEGEGNVDLALEYYQQVYDMYGSEFAEGPKALFSVARLHESKQNRELAKAIFQQLIDEFASSEYAKLAQTRLVVLP